MLPPPVSLTRDSLRILCKFHKARETLTGLNQRELNIPEGVRLMRELEYFHEDAAVLCRICNDTERDYNKKRFIATLMPHAETVPVVAFIVAVITKSHLHMKRAKALEYPAAMIFWTDEHAFERQKTVQSAIGVVFGRKEMIAAQFFSAGIATNEPAALWNAFRVMPEMCGTLGIRAAKLGWVDAVKYMVTLRDPEVISLVCSDLDKYSQQPIIEILKTELFLLPHGTEQTRHTLFSVGRILQQRCFSSKSPGSFFCGREKEPESQLTQAVKYYHDTRFARVALLTLLWVCAVPRDVREWIIKQIYV